MDAIHAGKLHGCYIMGENPAMSDPDVDHARDALAKLDWLVVQDIFLTETAYFADVVLPASAFPEKTGTFTNTDRQVQLGRAAINPPGDARQDLWIIQEMARGLGLDWNYGGAKDVFNEMRKAMHSIAGITWERLEAEHSVTYRARTKAIRAKRSCSSTSSRRPTAAPSWYRPSSSRPTRSRTPSTRWC